MTGATAAGEDEPASNGPAKAGTEGAEWHPLRIRFDPVSSTLSATVGQSKPIEATVIGQTPDAFFSRCEINLSGAISGGTKTSTAVRNLRTLNVPREKRNRLDGSDTAAGEQQLRLPDGNSARRQSSLPPVGEHDDSAIDVTGSLAAVPKYWRKDGPWGTFRYIADEATIFLV